MANQLTVQGTNFKVGDTIIVQQKIKEGNKFRTQPFEGIVIAIKNCSPNKMFTVRKISTAAVGVERIWPAISPWISSVSVKKEGDVRRAKLYYLRKRIGKQATKIKAKTPLSK